MSNTTNRPTLSKWQIFLQRYLELSIQFCSYASNTFLLSVSEPYFNKLIRVAAFRYAFYLLYSALLFEIIRRLVNKYYKPKFISVSEYERLGKGKTDVLVLDENGYAYRQRVEKLIFELLIYYAFNILVAIIAYNFGSKSYVSGKYIALGLTGSLVSILNLFGVGILAALEQKMDIFLKRILLYLGLMLAMPQVLYIIYAIFYIFIRLR